MKLVRYSIAGPLGILAAGVTFLCLERIGDRLGLAFHPPVAWSPVFALLCFAAPLVVGALTVRGVAGLRVTAYELFRRVPTAVRLAMIGAYLITWAFGVPAVLTAQHAEAVDAYKVEKARENRVWAAHPWIRTSAALPVLPGVIVSHHEYQVAGLNGWGGWQVHVWYWVGVRRILERTNWIS